MLQYIMKNILVLYNPYYEENIIEQHLEILKDSGAVAFGKIRSKNRDYESEHSEKLECIYNKVSKNEPIQLFLTDYNSMFVANVIAVKTEKTILIKAPKYYDRLDVEKWFIIDDLRLLASDDFKNIRDNILSNFIATNYNNRTYAVYGNKYAYPMEVSLKEEINYFEKENNDFKYYTDIFKSRQQLQIRQSLIDFAFGEDTFYNFASNTQDNLISAEVEYQENKQNPLHDYSSVVIQYSKAAELELHRFMKLLFAYLIQKDESLQYIPYSIQGRDYVLSDIQEHKANYGTYKFLVKSYKIKDALNSYLLKSNFRYFVSSEIPQFINTMQSVRNESVHGGTTSIKKCKDIRNSILGIQKSSFLGDLIVYKQSLK